MSNVQLRVRISRSRALWRRRASCTGVKTAVRRHCLGAPHTRVVSVVSLLSSNLLILFPLRFVRSTARSLTRIERRVPLIDFLRAIFFSSRAQFLRWSA